MSQQMSHPAAPLRHLSSSNLSQGQHGQTDYLPWQNSADGQAVAMGQLVFDAEGRSYLVQGFPVSTPMEQPMGDEGAGRYMPQFAYDSFVPPPAGAGGLGISHLAMDLDAIHPRSANPQLEAGFMTDGFGQANNQMLEPLYSPHPHPHSAPLPSYEEDDRAAPTRLNTARKRASPSAAAQGVFEDHTATQQFAFAPQSAAPDMLSTMDPKAVLSRAPSFASSSSSSITASMHQEFVNPAATHSLSSSSLSLSSSQVSSRSQSDTLNTLSSSTATTVSMSSEGSSKRNPFKKARKTIKLTDYERKGICKHVAEHPDKKQEEVAQLFGVERSTISKIVKNKEKWLAIPSPASSDAEDADADAPPPAKRSRPPSPGASETTPKKAPAKAKSGRFPELEEDLAKWVQEQSDQGIAIDDDTLTNKAKLVASSYKNSEGFKGSPVWLEKFKERARIKDGKFWGLPLTRTSSRERRPTRAAIAAAEAEEAMKEHEAALAVQQGGSTSSRSRRSSTTSTTGELRGMMNPSKRLFSIANEDESDGEGAHHDDQTVSVHETGRETPVQRTESTSSLVARNDSSASLASLASASANRVAMVTQQLVAEHCEPRPASVPRPSVARSPYPSVLQRSSSSNPALGGSSGTAFNSFERPQRLVRPGSFHARQEPFALSPNPADAVHQTPVQPGTVDGSQASHYYATPSQQLQQLQFSTGGQTPSRPAESPLVGGQFRGHLSSHGRTASTASSSSSFSGLTAFSPQTSGQVTPLTASLYGSFPHGSQPAPSISVPPTPSSLHFARSVMEEDEDQLQSAFGGQPSLGHAPALYSPVVQQQAARRATVSGPGYMPSAPAFDASTQHIYSRANRASGEPPSPVDSLGRAIDSMEYLLSFLGNEGSSFVTATDYVSLAEIGAAMKATQQGDAAAHSQQHYQQQQQQQPQQQQVRHYAPAPSRVPRQELERSYSFESAPSHRRPQYLQQ